MMIPKAEHPVLDPVTELMRLVERQHQELVDLRNELQALRTEFRDEQCRRRMLSGRFDSLERSAP